MWKLGLRPRNSLPGNICLNFRYWFFAVCVPYVLSSACKQLLDVNRYSSTHYTYSLAIYIRGLQCFKLNGNHTENDRYWQKNNFLLFAKCLKMYSFFCICILRLQKVLYDPKKFFLEKYQYGYQKTQNFMLISNSLMPT
jgi:hypothetical protein